MYGLRLKEIEGEVENVILPVSRLIPLPLLHNFCGDEVDKQPRLLMF